MYHHSFCPHHEVFLDFCPRRKKFLHWGKFVERNVGSKVLILLGRWLLTKQYIRECRMYCGYGVLWLRLWDPWKCAAFSASCRDAKNLQQSVGLLPLGYAASFALRLWILSVASVDRYWQGILIILVFYSSWVAPFEFGFVHNPRGALLAVDNVVNFFFLIDIVLTFFVAYRDNSTFLMECSLRRISFR